MIKIVDVLLYRCSVVFLIESTLEEWKTFFDEQYKDNKLQSSNDADVREMFEDNTSGFVISTGLNDYICYISNSENAGLVAHEIFHAANAVLQGRGVTLDSSGEAYAYMIEYLTNEFYNIINEEESDANDESKTTK